GTSPRKKQILVKGKASCESALGNTLHKFAIRGDKSKTKSASLRFAAANRERRAQVCDLWLQIENEEHKLAICGGKSKTKSTSLRFVAGNRKRRAQVCDLWLQIENEEHKFTICSCKS